MSCATRTAALLVLALFACVARATTTEALQTAVWASSCMACHGPEGRAKERLGHRLAGQTSAKLYQKLLDFKYGRREATVMHQHAKGYSEAELKRIADYIAAQGAQGGAR